MRLKLVSGKDSLLGHVDVPASWEHYLDKHGVVEIAIMPRLQYAMSDPMVAPELQTVVLARAGWSHYRGAVYLAHGTVEELEKLDGCSFAPSMEFLRSHLA